MKQIGIIGAGHVGSALAKRLVKLGYAVQVANSKGRQSLQDFAKSTGAKAVNVAEVSAGVDVLIIAIPFGRVADLPTSIFNALAKDAIIVDTGNYYPARDGSILEIDRGLSESQWISQQLGRPVVKAFNNIIASRLLTQGRLEGDRHRIALPVAGGDLASRTTIMALVEALGFSAFDAGPLAESWRQHPGQPAYCTDPNRTELPLLLARADKEKAAKGRDAAIAILAKLPPDYPADQLVRASRFLVGLDKLKPTSWLVMLRLGLTILLAKR